MIGFTRHARTLAALLIGVVATLVSAPAPAADAPRDTLRLSVFGDPHTLNALLATDGDENELAGLVMESLVDFDSSNAPVPVLATMVPTQANGGISADGKTITFHLRHGVKWHDGADFTAKDVLFTIAAIRDEKNNVANRDLYANIAEVTAPDAFTVRFTLKTRQAFFLSEVAAGYPIVPAHLLATSANLATDPFDAAPIGTGPYRFVRWERGDRIEFAANPAYYGGAPKIPHVVVSIVPDVNTLAVQLRQHAVDFASVESSVFNQLRDAPGLVRTTDPLNDVVALSINVTRPIMRDRTVRLAIVKAIDRKRLVQTITFGTGTPAYADLPFFMYDGHAPAGWDVADPASARAMLDADGWKLGPDGIRVKNGEPLRLTYIDFGGSVSGAAIDVQIVQMLRDVGIATDYKTFAPGLYFEPAERGGPVMSGNFDLAGIGFRGGTNPGNAYIYSCATRSPNGFNSARYCNAEMDRLLVAVQREYDRKKQNALVAKIEDLAATDVPYVFLYHTPYRLVMDAALVRPPASLGNYWYGIAGWSFKPGAGH
jgi:peptide/nickel transport system substrate-binding protein